MNDPQKQANRHGKSRKGPWHMAKTIASGLGMTNAWLAEQGVLNLKNLRAELAHLRRTARCGPACRGDAGRCPETGRLTQSIRRFRFRFERSDCRELFDSRASFEANQHHKNTVRR